MRKHRAMKTIVIKKQDHHSSNRQTSDMLTARDPKDMSFILPLLNERRISIHRFLFNSILFRMYSKKETYVAFEPFCRNASVGSHLTRDNEAPDLEPGSGNTLRKYKPNKLLLNVPVTHSYRVIQAVPSDIKLHIKRCHK